MANIVQVPGAACHWLLGRGENAILFYDLVLGVLRRMELWSGSRTSLARNTDEVPCSPEGLYYSSSERQPNPLIGPRCSEEATDWDALEYEVERKDDDTNE
jgi:hypothetical protein